MKTWLISVSVAAVLISGGVQAAGDPEAGAAKVAACAACHGPNGNSVVPMWPKLANQHAEYLVKQLQDFKSGARKNDQMSPQALLIKDDDVQDIAAYFEAQQETPGTADPAQASKGKKIFLGGNPATGVPACTGCHGPTGAGLGPAKFPRIAGQQAQYLDSTLKGFRSGARTNDPNSMMRDIAARMTDQEIATVSQYAAGLSQ